MIPFLKILHTHVDDGSPDVLSPYVLDMRLSKVSEAKKNLVTINLKNVNGALNNFNFERDKSSIEIYIDWSPITTQDPIMVANIDSISYSIDNKGAAKIKIKALDKTGLFLSKLWSYSYTDESPHGATTGYKANEAIINVIEHTQDTLDVADRITFNNVASTKSDGTAFTKNVNVSKTWKPLYEWLNEFSTVEYTDEDRGYVYHLDKDNDLHWGYPYQKIETVLTSALDSTETTVSVTNTDSYADTSVILIEDEQITYTGKTATTFTGCTRGANSTIATTHILGSVVSGQSISSGKGDVYKMTIDTDGEGEYNMIIYNSGNTPAGYDYLWYEVDKSEIGNQIKMKFYEWKDINLSVFNAEKTWTDPVTGYGWDGEGSYPTPNGAALSSGNPWHPTWNSALSIESDSDYQDAFLANTERVAESKADGFFRTGHSKFNGSVEMKGTHSYSVNEIVTIYSAKQGITKRLRIKAVRHIYTVGGWFTTIDLETDEAVKSS